MRGRDVSMRRAAILMSSLCLLVLLVASPAPARATAPPDGPRPSYLGVLPAKAAVLSSDYWPTWVAGVVSNYWEDVLNILIADPYIEARAIISYDIVWFNALEEEGFDVLILPDNIPSEASWDCIKAFWEDGGTIIAMDTAIEFLCYAGLLPAASEGSNGYGTYWSYDAGCEFKVNVEHPITGDYPAGAVLKAGPAFTACAAYHDDWMSGQPEWANVVKILVNKDEPNKVVLAAYEPGDGKGKIIFMGGKHATFASTLLRNAVKWAAGLIPMQLSVGYEPPEPRQNDTLVLIAVLTTRDGVGIAGATVTANLAGRTVVLGEFLVPGAYASIIDISDLVGEFTFYVRAEKPGLGVAIKSDTITITGVLRASAWAEPSEAAEGDVITAFVQVLDFSGRPVEGANVTITVGAEELEAGEVGGGLYKAEISTAGLSGHVTASFTVEKEGYISCSGSFAFEVAPPPEEKPEGPFSPEVLSDIRFILGAGALIIALIALVMALVRE